MLKHLVYSCVASLLSCGAAIAQTCALPISLPNTLTNGTNADAMQVMANFTTLLNCINHLPAPSAGGVPSPQGRLTLVMATPVMTSSQTGKTTIYYTPYLGNQVLITTNGMSFTAMALTELANNTTNSSTGNAGPAAVAASSNYDLFVWSNSGTLVLTRGPAWTSDTGRGAGAGTTELQRVAGIWTNKNAISNGPAANLGTYVGTVRSNATSNIDFVLNPSAAAGGSASVLGVWNAYNRVRVVTSSQDSADWTYATSTWRQADGNSNNRISYIDGLGESAIDTSYTVSTNSNSSNASIGVNQNSATATPRFVSHTSGASSGVANPKTVIGTFPPALGFSFVQAMEYASSTAYFYGNGGAIPIPGVTNVLIGSLEM